MEKEKKKIKKTCENCAYLIHGICGSPGYKCDKWTNKKYTCRRCEFAPSCILLGKNNPSCFGFCENFLKKDTKNPYKIFPDADKYRKYLKEKKALKEGKPKKKDVGKKELFDTDDKPIKSPKVKVKKPPIKVLDPKLQDTDRKDWSPLDKIDEIISRNYDPEAFALVDERDLPKSDNIIRFILEPEFLNQPLYPRQLQICLDFFQAYCPYCSNTDWIRNKVEVNTPVDEILDRTVLYRKGVCPKCGKTKYDALKEGSHTDYTSLVLAVGQRCIIGSSLVLTEKGLVRFKTIAKGLNRGKYEYKSYLSLENGAFSRSSHIYVYKPEKVFKVKMSNGYYIVGTPDHPILTEDGFLTLKEISERLLEKEIYVPVYYGQQVFGKKVFNFQTLNKKIYQKYKNYGYGVHNIPTPIMELDENIAKMLGFWVAEGNGGKIWNWNKKVNKFNYTQLNRLYPGGIKRGEHGPKIRFKSNLEHFNELLDNQLNKTSAFKYVPSHILQSPKNIQCSFLQGLFEGDGYVSKKRTVCYTTISKRLAYDVSAMLSNIGIINGIKTGWSWATNGSKNQISKRVYHVSIRGAECIKFLKEINFFSARKRNRLKKIKEFYATRTNRVPFNYEKFPPSVWVWMLKYVKDIKEYVKNTYLPFTYQMPGYNNPSTYIRPIWLNGIFKLRLRSRTPINRRMLEDTNKYFRSSVLWNFLPEYLRNKWIIKYRELMTTNRYFVMITSCRMLKKKYATYDFEIPYHHRFIANGLVNHNSGKTSLVWMVAPAIIHEYLQLTNPAKFMKQLDVTEFHATFIGVTADDVFKNVWSPMDNVFTWSPWYKQYHQFLDEEGKRIGVELYKHMTTFIAYNHKGIFASSSSADFRKLRGRTRILGSIDEGAYLTGDKIMMNAWQAYDALNNSLSTLQTAHEKLLPRFPNVPNAYGLYTSSTRSKNDFIMGMYKRSKRVNNIYGRKLPTWDFNPNMPKDCEFIRTKYMEDFVSAERDYASNPPFASDPFIRKASTIVPILSKRKNTLILDKIKITKDSLGGKALYPTIKCIPHSYPCCLSIDAGLSHNSFAVAITHLIAHPTDPEDALIATSGLLEIKPMEGIPISHNKVYEHVIRPIIETYNVKLFVTDSWQGVDFQSRVFSDYGIDATQYSLRYEDFESLRTRIHSETWVLPALDGELKDVLDMDKDFEELTKRKPVSHLMIQLLVSKDTGRTITKNTDAGEDFTDDLLRAAALGVAMVESEEYGPMFSGEGKFEKPRYTGSLGAVAGVSGSSNSRSVPGVGLSITYSGR